jgi:hypothetical protein
MQLSDELFMMPTLDDSHPLTSADQARRSGHTSYDPSGASKPGAGSSKGLYLFGSKARGVAAAGTGTSTGAGTTEQQDQPTESGGAMLQMEEEEEQW